MSTAACEFLKLPKLDLERLEVLWQEAVFALYLDEDKIEPEVVENKAGSRVARFTVKRFYDRS